MKLKCDLEKPDRILIRFILPLAMGKVFLCRHSAFIILTEVSHSNYYYLGAILAKVLIGEKLIFINLLI